MSKDGTHRSSIRTRYAIEWTEENNIPIYIGEFGARAWVDGYLQYLEDLIDLFDSWNLHYAYFVWRAKSYEDFGIYPLRDSLDPWSKEREALLTSKLKGSIKPNFTGTP